MTLFLKDFLPFGTQLLVFLGAYLALRRSLRAQAQEIKHHTDVSVRKLNGTATAIIHSFDRPAWVKAAVQSERGTEFRMIEVNDLYGEIFGITRSNYIGRTDLEAGWPHELAQVFYQHDLKVWASGEAESFEELINGRQMRFRKLRLVSPEGKLKGVMGYSVDCADKDSCPFFKEPQK